MSKRKTKFKWYYYRKGKRHLTKKAKQHLSEKLRQHYKEKKRIIKKNFKETLFIKLIYDSPRGSGHDFFLEVYAEEIAKSKDKLLSVKDKVRKVISKIQKGEFETDSPFNDFYENMDYNNIEIGTEEITETDEDEKELFVSIQTYKYRIPKDIERMKSIDEFL